MHNEFLDILINKIWENLEIDINFLRLFRSIYKNSNL
jgi:hypothetical protein